MELVGGGRKANSTLLTHIDQFLIPRATERDGLFCLQYRLYVCTLFITLHIYSGTSPLAFYYYILVFF